MPFFNKKLETLPPERFGFHQLERFRELINEIDGKNQFYTQRLRALDAQAQDFKTPDDVKRFPFTAKQDLVDDQAANPPFGTNHTYPIETYTRYHQTSGTTGTPLKILDTAESWDWWGKCWAYVFTAAGLTAKDRLFVAFGFGPFIGFWAAVEGARQINALMVPGGGRDSLQRLQLMRDTACTALCSTPTYALRLAEVARESNFHLRALPIKTTIHAGEPGANVPTTKRRIEEAWGASCYDHAGASEVGAFAFECEAQPNGMHVNEAEFFVEVIDPDTGEDIPIGQQGELVVTNFGRFGFPVIRYRTGDIVQLADDKCDCGRTFVRCEGGIIGRRDDMFTVKGVNIYPSGIENLVRSFKEVCEFRVTVSRKKALDVLTIEIECLDGYDAEPVARKLKASMSHNLGLHPIVKPVAQNTLPRFELKARRFRFES